jgi:hypothetical protein
MDVALWLFTCMVEKKGFLEWNRNLAAWEGNLSFLRELVRSLELKDVF